MKVSKDALRTARGLLRVSMVDARVDSGRVRMITAKLAAAKPRNYLSILHAYSRMLRLELEESHAVIDSATKLDEGMRAQILGDLKEKYGADVTTEFRVDPELLGGLRVKVGSDVWDGTVKARIARLEEAFKH